MIKIAIYDGSTCGNKNCLTSLVSQFFLSKNIPHCITAYDSGIELLVLLKTEQLFDIALIEIAIPDSVSPHTTLAGDNRCVLIFTTFPDEFTLRDNPLYSFDYFFYSAQPSIVFSSLERVLFRINKKKGHIPIKINGDMKNFPASKIIYIESSKHYLFFHITNGMALKMYAKLDEYENILSEYKNFLRCHQRSFIVNMDFIKQLCGHDFILQDDVHIPVRKSGFSNYKKKYFTYTLIKDIDTPLRNY